jgi:hypothetical protein
MNVTEGFTKNGGRDTERRGDEDDGPTMVARIGVVAASENERDFGRVCGGRVFVRPRKGGNAKQTGDQEKQARRIHRTATSAMV